MVQAEKKKQQEETGVDPATQKCGEQGLRPGRESGAFFTAVSEGAVGRDRWRQSYDGGSKNRTESWMEQSRPVHRVKLDGFYIR